MRMRIHERRRQRDLGLNMISTWTRGTFTGGLLLTGGLGAALAWTAPGHTARTSAPQPISDERSSSASGATAPPTGSTRHTAGRKHHAPTTRSTVIQPPVRPLQRTTQPPKTASGGS